VSAAPLRLALVQCVAHVCEGRDRRVLDDLIAPLRAVAGTRVADVHMDPDDHRSVITILGPPASVEQAALALAVGVLARLDLRRHRGLLPRTGSLDLLPFVPLGSATMAQAIALARRVGQELARSHNLPVFFYGEAATRPERRWLGGLRGAQYEGLPHKLAEAGWQPDAGPPRFDEMRGAVAVGARRAFVGFNVWLDTGKPEVAREVAVAVRESAGGLAGVQALGVALPRRGIVQVAMYLLDVATSSVPAAFDRVRSEAAARGVAVRRSELVGLVPREAFAGRTPESVGLVDFEPRQLLESHLPGDA